MKMITVRSATLRAVGYDAERQLLQIQFQDRSQYQYFGVPAAIPEALLRAPSKGTYFNQSVRLHFAHVRVNAASLS